MAKQNNDILKLECDRCKRTVEEVESCPQCSRLVCKECRDECSGACLDCTIELAEGEITCPICLCYIPLQNTTISSISKRRICCECESSNLEYELFHENDLEGYSEQEGYTEEELDKMLGREAGSWLEPSPWEETDAEKYGIDLNEEMREWQIEHKKHYEEKLKRHVKTLIARRSERAV